TTAAFIDRMRGAGAKETLPIISVSAGAIARFVAADLGRSDHSSFWAEGIPALQITDSANFRNPNYHCGAGPDVVEKVDLPFLGATARATAAAIAATLDAP